jgi:diguanylate cyclase (GGDEF)-like protein/hemerythrin-like metal-binding protein
VETFVWDKHFTTGLETVDQQHRSLVELVNELGQSLIDGKAGDDAALEPIIGRLTNYSDYHFTEEERLMAEAGVDARHVERHKAIHQNFLAQVMTMWNSRRSLQAPASVLLEFLISWLSFHFLGEDQAMARQIALIKAGVSAAAAFDVEAAPQDNATNALLRALRNLYHVMAEQNHGLAVANQLLEERVAERTRALEEANLALEAASRTDVLMGIANRMCFNETFVEEWRRARRRHDTLSLLMLDVDHFKRYNDHYGHLEGDDCLRSVARSVAAAVRRSGDLVARYGGEELVVLLPDTDLPGACQVAENIRRGVEQLALPHGTSPVTGHVTLSIGVAAGAPGPLCSAEDLLAAADQALYRAKAAGRNCVEANLVETPVS